MVPARGERFQIGGRAVGCGHDFIAELLTGAKATAFAGEQDGAAGWVVACGLQRSDESAEHRDVDGIEFVGAVEDELVPSLVPFDPDGV